MKKEYISPKLESIKINSEEQTAAFVTGNYNSKTTVYAGSNALNTINY